MFKNKVLFSFLLMVLLQSSLSFGQMPLDQNTKISILTCQEGNELYSLFGHTAIRIKDDAKGLDYVYNYGSFDFNTENFYLKFIKGDLRYFVSAYAYNEFFYEYTLENRSIYEQTLNLTNSQKQQLFDALNRSLLTDEKYYTYKFIDRNCTNMVVDKVNQALGQKCVVKTTENGESYRQILFPYLKNHFYENLGINIIFGMKTDEDGEKLFLPNQFMESLKVAKFNGKALSEAPKTILQSNPSPSKSSIWNNFYTFFALLLLVVLIRRTWIYLAFFILLGLFGVFLSVVGFYSYHEEVSLNYNVLLFNPLLLLLAFFYFKKNFVWLKRMCQVSIIALLAFVIILLNKPNLLMFLPMMVSSTIMLFYFLRKSNKHLLPSVE